MDRRIGRKVKPEPDVRGGVHPLRIATFSYVRSAGVEPSHKRCQNCSASSSRRCVQLQRAQQKRHCRADGCITMHTAAYGSKVAAGSHNQSLLPCPLHSPPLGTRAEKAAGRHLLPGSPNPPGSAAPPRGSQTRTGAASCCRAVQPAPHGNAGKDGRQGMGDLQTPWLTQPTRRHRAFIASKKCYSPP